VERLKALPVQLVEVDDGVILRRGCTQLMVSGPEAAKTVGMILTAAYGAGITVEEARAASAAPLRDDVEDLIVKLRERLILVPGDAEAPPPPQQETELEVFYWHFGTRPEQVAQRIQQKRIAILGVNTISRRLATVLAETGVAGVEVIDFPLLRNLRLFDDRGRLNAGAWGVPGKSPLAFETWADGASESMDCLVATSDFGAQQIMRDWNRFCVQYKQHFFPVVLQDVIGYVGPLVVPGETACFECLRGRQNANMDDPKSARAAEDRAFQGQMVNGFHPSLASVLGDFAAIELTKFYSGSIPASRAGSLIEVNLLYPELNIRRVLKVPRCAVCSNLNRRSSASVTKDIPSAQDWSVPK